MNDMKIPNRQKAAALVYSHFIRLGEVVSRA